MKTITFPVGYRPNYLIEFLDCLKQHDLSDYTIICSAENCQPCIDILNSCEIPMTILHNKDSLNAKSITGVRTNPYNALKHAFDIGSDFNVHLEDDLILAPDVFNLSDWYYNTYKDAPLSYMSYGLFNHDSCCDRLDVLEVIHSFEGLGWCIFKENWEACFDRYWFDDELGFRHLKSTGWDWAISGAYAEFGYHAIRPVTARTNHNGRDDGTHCTTVFHDSKFIPLNWNTSNVITEFKAP